MLKTILFTHTDLDGAGCRVIFELTHLFLQKGIDYSVFHCSNSSIDKDVREKMYASNYINVNTVICFADICPSVEVIEEIAERFKKRTNILIWDHHKTNLPIKDIIPNAFIVPENDNGVLECGTSLMYKYFSKKGRFLLPHMDGKLDLLKLFVETVRSYDTWDWKKTNNMLARKLYILLTLLGLNAFCERYIDRFISGYDIQSGNLILNSDMEFIDIKLDRENKMIGYFSKDDIIDVTIRGFRTALLIHSANASISDLADVFLERYPEFDIFAFISFYGDMKFEFRTKREDLDLGEIIAKPVGGGGHPQAAGSPVPDYLKDLFKDIIVDHLNGEVTRIP